MPTYQQVIEYAQTDAGRAGLQRVQDCFPDEPALGMTWTQIGAASQAVGYPTSWPAFAVSYYQLLGQNLWPNCRDGMNVGPLPSGANPNAPANPAGVPGFPIDTDTLFLIGGGLIALLVIKRLIDG